MKKYILFLLLLSISVFGQVIKVKHTAYEITFDTKIYEPLYTHYILSPKNALLKTNQKEDRTIFKQDTLVDLNKQGSDDDYKGQKKYDRGHLAPNNDFRYNYNVEYDSMLYTNCSPQVYSFNRGVWHSLEMYVEDIAKKGYEVEVWTGCIYGNKKIGKLLIPTFYWKLIKYNGVYEAYSLPNSKNNKHDFKSYKVNPEELQKLIN